MKEQAPFENDRGTYLLLLELEKAQKIKPGRLAETEFRSGTYIYVGRARKGLKARIRRHLRKEKKRFWHIDYLLPEAIIREIWTRENFFDECQTASRIQDFFSFPSPAHKGFGSSDCRCAGHLYPISSSKNKLKILLQKMGFQRIVFHENKL